ncbi:MAG: NAD-dependent epimerase/dehydratase family protein [Vicinamibacterales bacterium]
MPARPERVLVTGATGALGPAVIEALRARGRIVRALVRRRGAEADPAVEWVDGDLTDPASLVRAVHDADAVVHLAALLHIVNPAPALRPRYQAVNVDGTAALVAAARASGVRRFVFAGTTAVYGPTAVAVDESAPPAPDSWYAASKLDAEARVLEAHQPGVFQATVLRLSAVYGPRVKGNYQRLLHALAARRFVPIGAGHNRRSLIYETDAADAFAAAVDRDAVDPAVFNVSDGTPHALGAIVEAMCLALGRPAPRFALPAAPVRAVAGLASGVCRVVGLRPPGAVSSIAKYFESSVVDSARASRDLGFRPAVDLDTGWRRTVEALRADGALPGEGR